MLAATAQPGTTIAELAALMGVSAADCAGFVECLSVWTSKGYTLEAAIERNLAVMSGMVNRIGEINSSEYLHAQTRKDLREWVAETVWTHVRGGAAA